MKYVFMFLLAIAASAVQAKQSLNDQYPGAWHRDVNVPILRVLTAHHVRNCGDVAYKPSRKYSSEYLVYCSMDDGVWHVYLVWTGINKLMGPYPADPHVKPPKPIIPPSSEY